MSVRTTYHLTREDALDVLRRAPYDRLGVNELAELLEAVYGPPLSDPDRAYRVTRRGPPADVSAEDAETYLREFDYDRLDNGRLGDLLDLLTHERVPFENYLVGHTGGETFVTTAQLILGDLNRP
ncbi:hypothetical protein [Deinococcus soli (ex Cha et al. 2016)]|uniref:Uncharacterized protein n=2 Tax=Deinococcus soli (ex Cha et al. 2016) TaxID=1309411 RepID=A0ACC6KKS2_9DEIO|nr:hypothetical protein [Deinococcus soli (ex Cha et al. 2016)]MDR6218624.1 hypothetical protein [Deinococcus soli (ex Cha et al. 2016)]MDR6328421.1 hypothetical protein [Deinococcus soli (ex Cha et al. 2016)]MDR6753032.1 hypothetical protein [Deinococcus soli (ex Cha et al. 2016)]